MSLFSSIFFPKKQISKNASNSKSSTAPKSLFEEKKEWHRRDLTRKLVKSSPYIPGTGGVMYKIREREKMIDDIFPQKRFGTHISEQEVKRRFGELRKEKYLARTGAEKREIERKMQYLKEFTQVKKF